MVFYAAFNSNVFQSYHGDSSHYSCLSRFSPVLGWALKCLAQGHSHEKTKRIQCGSNPGPLDYESKTLPLGHAGPAQINEPYSVKKGVGGVVLRHLRNISTRVSHHSTQADLNRNYLLFVNFSACQRTTLHPDSIGC